MSNVEDTARQAERTYNDIAERYSTIKNTPFFRYIVSLMIHELATNPTKYGSLSNDGGTVSLKGSIIKPSNNGKDEDCDELRLIWKEVGGPPVNTPTRSGFGTSILNRIIRDQLHGEFEPQWLKGGLECNIRIRL